MKRPCSWLAAAVVAMAVAPPVAAHPPTYTAANPTRADRVKAQKLAGEALDLYEAEDYGAALERFEEAHALVPAPTLLLRVARSLDKLDRVQEAAERYREVIAWELDRFAPRVHRKAREDAVPELAALLEQIPKLVVTVSGPGATDAEVTLDGEVLASDRWGDELPRDPATVTVVARVDDREVTETVTLARGATERIELVLPEPPPTQTSVDPEPSTSSEGDLDGWTIAGWVGVGLGGAALLAGTGTGIAVVTQEGDLEERCPNRQCLPADHDDAESFDALRGATTGLLVAGGLLAAAGATILLVDPGASDEGDVTWQLGPGYAGIAGRF